MVVCFNLNPACDKTLEVRGFRVGGHLKAKRLACIPAGKGLNVARGLTRLGHEALATGFIGRGEAEWFASELARAGATSALVEVPGLTRTNTTIVDPDANTTTHVREAGFEVSAADCGRLEERLRTVLRKHEPGIAVFAGSLPPGFGDADLLHLMGVCRDGGMRVCLDSSGTALKAAVAAGVDLIKPNEEELAELVGRPGDALAAARGLLARVGTVLVSLGERGGIAVTREGAWGARAPLARAEVVNTVGCGDAFLCGWLAAGEEGRPAAEAIRWAVAAGSACATLPTVDGYDREMLSAMLARCEALEPAG